MITSPTRPIAWLSEEMIENAPRSCRMSSAAIVSRADAAFGERHVLGDRRIEVVAHHQHVEMLVDGVDRVRPRRIGGGRQHVGQAADLDDVRGVPAARAFGVIGVDGAALEGRDRVLDEAALVQRVGVDHHLHVVGDRRRSRQQSIAAGVVPQSSCSLSAQAPAATCSISASGRDALPLPAKAEIHRQGIGGLEHPRDDATGPACRWWRWCRSPGPCRRRASW